MSVAQIEIERDDILSIPFLIEVFREDGEIIPPDGITLSTEEEERACKALDIAEEDARSEREIDSYMARRESRVSNFDL